MVFEIYQPSGLLGAFIENMVYYAGWNPDHSIERLVPDGGAHLIIELDNQPKYLFENQHFQRTQKCTHSWVSGIHNSYLNISADQNSSMFIIRFKPVGLNNCAQISMHELCDKVLDADLIFGNPIEWLRESILEAQTPQLKFKAAENWLFARIKTPSIPETVVGSLANAIIQNPTAGQLSKIMQKAGYAQKHQISLFKQFIGVTPKEFQKIYRFNAALKEIETRNELIWTDLAYDLEYTDQSHFIHDFRSFSGFSPNKFLKERRDYLNYVIIK
ncbi:MAG: helix-turn-helix transcriptional regulator [Saprospiraceae bacterium]|nr:helix-turn-helix transcriptional regulator [Saprospiraceae bacterium]